MLSTLRVQNAIPVSDMKRAQSFYAEQLGIESIGEGAGGWVFACSGSRFVLVLSESAGKGQYSLMTWVTPDILETMATLRTNGVVFEDFDMPGLKTENGLATLGADKVAWFRDSEGNILAVAQLG